jgi:hypothetical protein
MLDPGNKGGRRMEPKKILAVLILVLILSVSLVVLGIGYCGGVRGIGLLGITFFVTFGVAIALGQLIPAGILLSSIIGASFSSFGKAHTPIRTV